MLAEVVQRVPVFHENYQPARNAILADRNLRPMEALLLIDCLHMRQQDRDFRADMRQRAIEDSAAAEVKEREFIDYCNNSWMPNAILFRFTQGEMFASSRDFQARDHRNRYALQLTQQRNREFREHDGVVMGEEKRMRDALAAHGPFAKRLFNTIAISGVTSQHFPQAEIAAAQHLPNPLERILP